MRAILGSWAVRAVMGAVVLAAASGCATGADEGDFVAPRGFTVAQTRQVVLGAHSFMRDEQQRLQTATRAARQLRRADEASARRDAPADRLKIEAVFHGTYAEGMTVAAVSHPAASLRVVPVSARPVEARLRQDGAMIAFEGAFPNVTSAFGGRDSRVEEFLLIPTESDIPTLAYDLYPGEEFARLEEEGGRLWAYASDGAGLFTIEPPVADDAAGKRVSGTWKLESSGNGYRITADIELRGLAFPVLLDPTFETPQWFRNTASQPTARAGAAGAFDLGTGCSMVFGGATNDSFSLAQDLSVRCADRLWKTALMGTTTPPARAYSAMAYHGGSTGRVFLYGGYAAENVLNDLWRADLTCTTPGVSSTCSVEWTQITVPESGPGARYLHGMAWNGSKLMVFGGVDASGAGLRDTWEYDADADSWTQACSDCFGGSFGLYGFATATLPGASRQVYVSGGYNNPAGGGDFLNSVSRWNGSSWDDVSGNDAAIGVTSSGTVSSPQGLAPAARYLHWMSPTSSKRFLMGSGLNNDGTTDIFTTDTWLWQDREAEGLTPQWLRQPLPTASLSSAPGERESATAIYDENLQETVLLGGLNSLRNVTSNARTYRSQEQVFSLTQSCANTVDTTLCDDDLETLTAVFPGLTDATTPACSDMQALFLQRDLATSTWSSLAGLATASFAGGVCSVALSVAWSPATIADYGVRVRDKRYVQGGSECTNTGSEISNASPKSACSVFTATAGSASCGSLLDPAFSSSSSCDNF